jgi:hypothetical protein
MKTRWLTEPDIVLALVIAIMSGAAYTRIRRFDAEARVGKVDAVVLEGLDLWFNSSDHLPPHLHARRRGEWEIRVYFLLCTDDELVFDCKWTKKNPSAKVLARIRKAVVECRVELLSEWEQKVSREA